MKSSYFYNHFQIIKKITALIVLLSLSCFITNCSQDADSHRAPPKIEDSFKTKSIDNGLLKVTDHTLIISKKSLEKEFLIQSSLIAQVPSPTSSGLRSRIIYFKKKQDHLFMLESSIGQLVTRDLPSEIILAQFSIISENENEIEFNFAKGMSHLFTTSEWHGHDSTNDPRDGQYSGLALNYSYIKETRTAQNQLYLSQIAQIGVNVLGVVVNVPIEVRYYLSPYSPDPNFIPKQTPKSFDQLGFFETMPFYDSKGNNVIYASKFDENSPIVFAISANTPPEFQEAVREGILYWNKIFEKDIVKVVMAPSGRTAPDMEYNIVQWVPWDQAGFAYADAQVDPRTGQTLHAQVYFTSVFGLIGKNRAHAILRKLKNKKSQSHLKISLRGFENHDLCDFDIQNTQFQSSLENLLQSNATDSVILKASQDYIREVVAHEIGHTLGLRHNFAGSLEANYPLHKRGELIKSYFEGNDISKEIVPSSSVMEYQLFEESAFTGNLIAQNAYSGSYDRLAIQYLYENLKEIPLKTPLFCTDSHISRFEFLDCARFDMGQNIPEYVQWTKENFANSISASLLENFLNALSSPFPDQKEALDRVKLPEVDFFTKSLYNPRSLLLKSFSKKTNLLKSSRMFYVHDFTNEEDEFNAKMNLLQSDLSKVSPLENLLRLATDNLEEQIISNFQEKMEKNSEFTGYDGQSYRLSEAEKFLMLKRVQKYAALFNKEILEYDLKQLGGDYDFADLPITSTISDTFAKLALKYITESSDKKVEVKFKTKSSTDSQTDTKSASSASSKDSQEKGDKMAPNGEITAKIRVYKYPHEIRLAASKILAAANGEAFDWGAFERKNLNAFLKKQIKEDLTVDSDQVDLDSAPRELRKWLFENSKVLESLN